MIFHQNVNNWLLYFFIHVFSFLIILEAIKIEGKIKNKKIGTLIRILYPLVLFFYSWHELNITITMFFGNHWATDSIVNIEKAIFGVHPTVWFLKFYNPILDEVMNIFYTGY